MSEDKGEGDEQIWRSCTPLDEPPIWRTCTPLERRALELWPPHYADRWLRAVAYLRTTPRGWCFETPEKRPTLSLVITDPNAIERG